MKARIVMPWDARVFVIAEAGVNHNGSLALAKELVDAAASAGADAVKFQTWKNEEILTRSARKVRYMEATTDAKTSLWDMANELALSYKDFRALHAHARRKGILFLSTADGFESLDFLADDLNLPILKIGSTEITHPQYLAACAAKKKPLILSTGLSSLGEVEAAVATIRKTHRGPLVLLQCTSAYPSPLDEVNVRAMATLARAFNLPVGLSDHSVGSEAAIAAVALGARVIEKHFTLDKTMRGPDHRASLDVGELTAFIRSIRNTERALGDGVKRMSASEAQNVDGIRRSIVARRRIPKGARLTADMLVCKRPGHGIRPGDMDKIVGLRVNQTILEDELVLWKHFR